MARIILTDRTGRASKKDVSQQIEAPKTKSPSQLLGLAGAKLVNARPEGMPTFRPNVRRESSPFSEPPRINSVIGRGEGDTCTCVMSERTRAGTAP
jgi:hypothetical protein